MHRIPNHKLSGLIFVILIAMLAIGLSPNGATSAAVNANFDALPLGMVDGATIPGIASISSLGNTTMVSNAPISAPFAGNALFNTGGGGLLEIDFSQPQSSYALDYEVNDATPGTYNYAITAFRAGEIVFSDNVPVTVVTSGTPVFGTAPASANTAIFDRIFISSTSNEWGLDNLQTADAVAGVSVIQSGGSTLVLEQGATTDSYQLVPDIAPTAQVDINLVVTNGACQVAPTTVTFTAGSLAPQVVTVGAVDDAIDNNPDTCTITQSIVTTDPAYSLVTIPDLIATVTDNDTAGVTNSKTDVNIAEGGATDTYTVVLKSEPVSPVTITIAGDAQCSVAPTTRTFTNLTWNTPQLVTVTAVDDAVAEPSPHLCTITETASNSGSDLNYVPGLSIAPVTGHITDNDTAQVTITPLTLPNFDEGTTQDYTIELATIPQADVTVNISSDTTQCSASPNTVTFNGNGSVVPSPATITVTAVHDFINEVSPLDCILTNTITSADPNYTGISIPVTAQINDIDVPGITLKPSVGTSVNVSEATPLTPDSYDISLDTIPQADVTITITPDAQCTVNPTSVTFTAPSRGPISVNVFAVDDAIPEALTHPCIVHHAVSATADTDYTGLTKDLTVNVTDNDNSIYDSTPAPGSTINLTTTQGTNTSTTITASNGGNVSLDVGAITLTGDAALTLTSAANFTLPNNVATAPISVQCDATNLGSFTTQLNVPHTGTAGIASPVSYTVNCQVNPPATPGYGSAPVPGSVINLTTTQGTNKTTTIIVTNTGTAQLNVGAITLIGDAALTLTTPASFPLVNTNDNGPITVQCDATNTGSFTTLVSVPHNGAGIPASPATYTVNCVVNAVPAPVYDSAPASGSVINLTTTQGTNKTTTIIVTNTGTAQLNVGAITLTGDAELTLTTPASFPLVNTNDSGPITVQCDATNTGSFTTLVSVPHNAAGIPASPAAYTVNCVVNAVPAPVYSSVPAPASVINLTTTQGTNTTTTIVVTNTGTAQLDVGAISLTGNAQLTLTTPASFPLVNTNDNGPITVQCDATNTGSFSTLVNVPHNGAGIPASPVTYTVNCTVNPIAAPVYSSAPASGSVINLTTTQGTNTTTTIVVTNNGTVQLDVGAITLTGNPALTLTTPASFPLVNLNDSGPITVQCDATNTGSFSTLVSVPHNGVGAPVSPATYTVNCVVNPAAAPVYSSAPVPSSVINLTTTQGTNITTTITAKNVGNAQLNVGPITLAGNAQLTLTTPTSFPLVNNGDTGPITVQCDATSTGSFTTLVSVIHDGIGVPTSPVTYTVNCLVNAVPAPVYSSTPAPASVINLSTTKGTNTSTTITVTNGGNAQLNVGPITLSANPALTLTTAASFPLVNNGDNGPITVQCDATNIGSFTTLVTVPHNGVGVPTSPVTYTVNCNVTAPVGPIYSSTPAPNAVINLTTQQGSNTSTTITVTSGGTAQLDVGPIVLTASPALSLTTPASFSISTIGGTAPITVQCDATNIGTFSTQLTVPHNGVGVPTTPVIYTVNCNVTAVSGPVYSSVPAPSGTVTITPTGVGSGASGTVTIKNTGTGTLHITGAAMDPTSSSHLTTSLPPPAQQSLTAGQTAEIDVQCDANFTGTATGKLIVTHDGSGAPQPATYTVNCTIGGTTGPGYGSFPSPGTIINLGTVLIGSPITANLVVSETGTSTLSVALSPSGTITGPNAAEFSIIAGAPPFNIPDGGASQTVVLQCIPTTQGLRLATLTFATNDLFHFPSGSVSYLMACVGSTVPVTTPTPIGFVPTAVPPTATVIIPATGEVTEVKGLSVRTGPYLGATLIGVARPGTTYSILAQNRDEGSFTWYLIKFGRQTGWVSGRFLTVTGTLDAVPFSGSIFDQIDNAPDIGVRLTTNAIIDLRRRPSPRTPRVATIPLGAEVTVLGITQEGKNFTYWIQVSYNGVIGWVPALPVTMRGPVANLPVR